MINTTDEIIILEQDENKLIKELRLSLMEARNLLIKEYNVKELPLFLDKDNKKLAFIYYFTEEKINNILLDKDFINNLLNYTEEKDGDNICVKYGFCPSNQLIENYHLKTGLKLCLLSMWKKQLILLPLIFTIGNSGISESMEKQFDKPILNHFRNYFNNKEKDQFSDDFFHSFVNRISRILRTTNYLHVGEVNIDEINSLHMYILNSQAGRIHTKVRKGKFFIEMFLVEIKNNNTQLNFNTIDYREWLNGYAVRYKKFSYIEYLSSKEELKEYRKEYNKKDTLNRKKIKKLIESGIKNVDIKENISRTEKELIIKEHIFEKLSLENKFFNIVSQPKSWINNPPIYKGYEYLDNYLDSRIWIKSYQSFMEERRKNGYETSKNQNTIFNFLMDYIFFYLKVGQENNQTNKIGLPLSPKDFHRVLYIKNTNNKEAGSYLTIIELLELSNRPASYKNKLLKTLEMYFNHIADYYEEDSLIWNKQQKNPIRKNDLYIQRRHNKTNKVIIPKKVYVCLKKYLFALESFGEYLLERSILENDIDLGDIDNVNSKVSLNCESLGYVPILRMDNKTIPVKEVPNIYEWRIRNFDKNKIFLLEKEEIINQRIPCLTLIRAFILALNTGLRSSQVLWLDIRNWDIHNNDAQQTYYKININTDKFKNEDWTTYISYQVRNSLLKETNFQKSMKDNSTLLEANYKGREHTRFSNILALFKTVSAKGEPIKYESFYKNWKELLWNFQNWMNVDSTTNYQFVLLEKPEVVNIEGNENRFCPLNIRAIHTPHSMRATFCTHMAEYLERSEIAELVGHASDLITSDVYIKPEADVLKEKIARATDILDDSVNSSYFDKNNKIHIKPNLHNSALQNAFRENKEQTIELFNITSISLNINKETEEQSKKALKLLKDARMDQIIFEPTHICPVGGNCPQEIMNIIIEKRRCGLCPLALKCIDNLNPIYAKQRDLIREIKSGKEQLDKSINEEASEIFISNIEDKVNIDIRELVSWKFSTEVLSIHYEKMKENKNLEKTYYVEMPEMVKNHLTKVSIANEKEYLLTRLADANSYSQFDNHENKYRADMLRRDIIKNLNLIEYDDFYVDEQQKIEVFCAMIKNMLDSNQIKLQQLVEYDCFKSIDKYNQKQPKLLTNNKILLLKQE